MQTRYLINKIENIMKNTEKISINHRLVIAGGLLLIVIGEQWLGDVSLTVLGTAVIYFGMFSKHFTRKTLI